jgi:hypothetical protein
MVGGSLRVLRLLPPLRLVAMHDIAEILLKLALQSKNPSIKSWRGVCDGALCDKFFSELQQVSGFLLILRFPPTIKMTATT